jgi:pyruvate,water dikinase
VPFANGALMVFKRPDCSAARAKPWCEFSQKISNPIRNFTMSHPEARYVVPLEALRMTDVETVGGKNASLGEMISQLAHLGVRVPGGFATTSQAFRDFLNDSDLTRRIGAALDALDVEDVKALAGCGAQIRQWVIDAPLPARLEKEIREHYQNLLNESSGEISVAVRSSSVSDVADGISVACQPSVDDSR